MKTQKIDNGLYRLLIPFDNLTTTVYIAVFDTGAAIIDAATYPEDVDNYIIPALAELGIDTTRAALLAFASFFRRRRSTLIMPIPSGISFRFLTAM